jgi:hypothetical protein
MSHEAAIINIKSTIITKLKKKMWTDREIDNKKKLNYYNEIINPKLEDQNYLFFVANARKKLNITKIRTSFHVLHSKTQCWRRPKTPCCERICKLHETNKLKDENHFLLECLNFGLQRH